MVSGRSEEMEMKSELVEMFVLTRFRRVNLCVICLWSVGDIASYLSDVASWCLVMFPVGDAAANKWREPAVKI